LTAEAVAPRLRSVRATRYVTAFREGGSLPGLVEADDDGLYVVKFRGAGQGPRALVAEWLVGEIGRAIGLLVPDIALVALGKAIADGEAHEEIHDLLVASVGKNLGLDFLPGSITFNPAVDRVADPDWAAAVVWLDAFATNGPNGQEHEHAGLARPDVALIDRRGSTPPRGAIPPRRPSDQASSDRRPVLLPFASSSRRRTTPLVSAAPRPTCRPDPRRVATRRCGRRRRPIAARGLPDHLDAAVSARSSAGERARNAAAA
jgi:hypothetical protein